MEDYAAWCQEHEPTEATVDALKDNGITSLNLLRPSGAYMCQWTNRHWFR